MRKLQTQDIFAAARVITEIGLKDELKEICKKSDDISDVWGKGFDLVYTIFDKAVQKGAEQKLYEFIGGILEKSADEVKTADALDIMDELTQAADIEQWKGFFTRLARLMKLK